MFFKKPKLRQFFSSFLVFALVLTLLPNSAFALTTGTGTEIRLRAEHFCVDNSGGYTRKLQDAENEFGGIEDDLSESLIKNFEQNEINTYVYSPDMREDERDGSVIPYFFDQAGRKWELYKVSVANGREVETPGDQSELMSPSAIKSATGINDYVVDTTDITLTPGQRNYYFIWYGWKLAEGEPEVVTSYQVTYDLNLPSELPKNGVTLFPVVYYEDYDRSRIDVGSEDGQLSVVKDAVEKLSKEVYSGKTFTVADFTANSAFDYVDFLVFANDTYYDFDGWYIEGNEETLYDIGSELTASDTLASEGTIAFKAKWSKIDPLVDYSQTVDEVWEELSKLTAIPPVLNSNSSAVDGKVLVSQWTDTDANQNNNKQTGNAVTLDENGTIYYQMSASVNSSLYTFYFSTDGRNNAGEDFMTFTLSLDVDDDLEFVGGEDGTAKLTLNSKILKVTDTNITGATWSEYPDENGDSTITFNVENVPQDNEITVTVKWNETLKNSINVAPSGAMTLTGFAFQLKDGKASENMQLETTGNIDGSIKMRIPNGINRRFFYQSILNILESSSYGYKDSFGTSDDPTAFAHAIQFTEWVTSHYDLSKDAKAILQNDFPVIATYPGTVTVTPADITIYMGGDGGYDAVVGENGEIAPSTNSLPHPLFTIDVPDGIDPEELTFTNGGDTWTVECDNPNSAGTKYYHFVPVDDDTDDVRVTYTYTDKSGKEHTVTSDKFDPTTMGDVFAELTVELYPGTSNTSQVRAIASNGAHYVASTSGTLTIRAVEDQDATSDIQDDAPEKSVAAGSAVAVKPAGGTVYTLNNTGVRLPTDSKPSLLFDSIIDDEKVNRTELLEDKADEKLGAVVGNTTRHYEIKYLDLVDANNGNAWITSSEGTYIYWGYPEGTGQSTNFTVLHFQDLHREGNDSGYDASDITELDVDRVEIVSVENTENGIKFHVEAGGFSPFALVWETTFSGGGTATGYTITAEAGNGGSISPSGSVSVTAGENQTFTITADDGYEIVNVTVDNKSVGAVSSYTFENVSANHTIKAIFKEESGAADPDDTGVSDWLNTDDHAAYLSGYPNDLFGANNNMTRGEVAQMFYNLLLDKDVTITVTFEDVAADAWYADAVNTLASLGMIKGVGDNRFEPERSITRAEFTTIAMHFTNGVLEGENIFPDVNPDDWFYDYVVGSIQYGWISGYPDGTFGPNNTITRAEVTTIVNRMLGRSVDKDYVDSHTADLRQFTDLAGTYWAYYDIMEATNGHEYTKIDGVEDWVRVN